jgi:TRAP-type C4-dicarboxylate transport system permease small subunit
MNIQKKHIMIEEVLCMTSTLFLILFLSVQVVLRYIFNTGLAWSEELSRISFIWVVYASISYTAKFDKHIRVTIIIGLFHEKVQKYILTVVDAIWLAMNILIVYQGVLYIFRLFEFPFVSQTMGFNLVYAYFIIPIGFSLQSFRILMNMISRLKTDVVDVHDSRLDL